MTKAKQIQQERNDANLKNHRERVVWLSGERPCWADGEPVDCHTRHVLLLQSQDALRSA